MISNPAPPAQVFHDHLRQPRGAGRGLAMEPGPPCMARGRHSTWEQGTQWLHGQRPALGSCWAPGASIPSMPARPSLFQRIARRDKPSTVSNAKK